MADEPTRSDDELEKLKLHKQRLELKTQIDALTAPWWRKVSLIATMTAIIAAVLPVTTAIQKHYENEREFRLQKQRQENDIRMAYLAQFRVPGQRMMTLRFLLATSTDPRLLEWASVEKKFVQAQLDSIEEQIQDVIAKLAQSPQGQTADELKVKLAELILLLEMRSLGPMSGPRPATGSPASAAPDPAAEQAGGAAPPSTPAVDR
jgi:hypothetical protein